MCPAGRPARPARPRYSVTLHVTLHWLGYLHRSWRAETTGIDVSQRAESIGEGIRPRGHRHMARPETTPCHAPVTPLSRSCHAPVTLTGGVRMRVGLCPSTLILPTCGCTSPRAGVLLVYIEDLRYYSVDLLDAEFLFYIERAPKLLVQLGIFGRPYLEIQGIGVGNPCTALPMKKNSLNKNETILLS